MLLANVSLVTYVQAQATSEALLTTENAYNPIPSADGKYIAYVRTGWGRSNGSGGSGRSNLVSEVVVMDAGGRPVAENPVADAFLSVWTPDSTDLVCFRDNSELDGRSDVIAAKQRNGPTGKIRPTFLKKSTRFESAMDQEEFPKE
jgi:Tol biopolymer transport system component